METLDYYYLLLLATLTSKEGIIFVNKLLLFYNIAINEYICQT